LGKFTEAAARPRAHRAGVILPALDRDEANVFLGPFEPDRFPGDAHADLQFRADGHPFDVGAKSVDEEAVALVSTVITDEFAEQTT